MNVSVFSLDENHGYSIKFSPFLEKRLACAHSHNYGLSGPGFISVLDMVPESNALVPVSRMQWTDGLFDFAWSEDHPDFLIAGSGDGSLTLWNLTQPQAPQKIWKEHSREVCSVDWVLTRLNQHIVTASWDQTVKLWDIQHDKSLATFAGHSELVYAVSWSPLLPNCFASVSGDKTVCIWNSTKPGGPVVKFPGHAAEILSCDWSRYDRNLLATAGVDGRIRGWDLRNKMTPCFELLGHEYAVKRIRFSPHSANQLASASYDFTTRLWNIQLLTPEVFHHHREFVYGLDFSCLIPNKMADCSWDRTLAVFDVPSVPA